MSSVYEERAREAITKVAEKAAQIPYFSPYSYQQFHGILTQTLQEHGIVPRAIVCGTIIGGSRRYSDLRKRDGYRDVLGFTRDSLGRRGKDGRRLNDLVSWSETKVGEETVEVVAYGESLAVLASSRDVAEKKLAEITEAVAKEKPKMLVFSNQWFDEEDDITNRPSTSLDDIILPSEQKAEIRQTVENFFNNRDVYKKCGMDWRRGILFCGPPGTGKTMLCRTLAQIGEVPVIYVKDLKGSGSQESALSRLFNRAREVAPAIMILEDLDATIKDEIRSVFLNELDGFKSNDGLLILATTNHLDKIDDALIKRPSRFDRIFKIGLPSEESREDIASQILFERFRDPEDAETFKAVVNRVARQTHGFSPAFIQEAIFGATLQMVHDEAPTDDLESLSDYITAQIDVLKKGVKDVKKKDEIEIGERGVGFSSKGGS